MNYDKLDLARKLDEMTKAVDDFKKHYEGDLSDNENTAVNTGRSRTRSPRNNVGQGLPSTSTGKKSHADSIRAFDDYK